MRDFIKMHPVRKIGEEIERCHWIRDRQRTRERPKELVEKRRTLEGEQETQIADDTLQQVAAASSRGNATCDPNRRSVVDNRRGED